MVSSGADRVVRVWDLEVWEEVECLGPEATAVQGIAYAPDGNVLLTASSDALEVWGLEPAVHHDTVPMDWRNLADLHLYYKDGQPRALGCCCSGSSVGVFMVDLRKVAPFSSSSAPLPGQQALPAAGAGGAVSSSLGSRLTGAVVQEYTGAPLPVTQQQQQQPARRADAGADQDTAPAYMSLLSEAAAAWGSPDAAEAGPLTRQLPRQRTPPRATPPTGHMASSSAKSRQAGQSPAAPVRRAGPAHPSPAAAPQHQQHLSSNNFPEVEILVPARRPSAADLVEQPTSSMQQPVSRGQQPQPAAANGRLQPSTSSSRANSGLAADVSQLAAGLAAASLQEALPRQQQQQASRSSSRPKEPPGALSATLAAWLDDLPESSTAAPPAAAAASAAHSKSSSRSSSVPASRMPSRQNMGSAGQQPQQQPAAPAADPIIAAIAARPGLKVELSRMVSALQVAKGFAGRGNLEGAYKSVLSQGDPALACSLLEAVTGRSDAFELNSLEPLIKLLELLLGSGQEQQVAVGLSVLGLVLRGPGQMVADVVGAPQPTGVDLSFEARRSKCLLLKMALEGLGLKVGVLSRGQGPVATRAQLLAEELKRIVA